MPGALYDKKHLLKVRTYIACSSLCARMQERWVRVQVRRFEEYMYGNSERFAEKAEVNA